MELILIRHGRPERVDYDPNGANPGLHELGHMQAKRMAEHLADEEIHALYVSPMQRAIDTAAPLESVMDMQATVVDDIAEFDLGHTSYIPADEAPRTTPEEIQELVDSLTAEPFTRRVRTAFDGLIERHPGETIAAVCHGGVISNLLSQVLDTPLDRYFNTDYTSITRIRARRSGGRSLASFNECHWLRQMR